MRRVIRIAGTAAAWLTIWYLCYLAVGHDLLLSSPADTLGRLGQLALTADFWGTVANSMGRIMLGFLMALVTGGLTAAVTARFAAARDFVSPFMNVLKATPVASFAILALTWVSGQNLSVFCVLVMVLPIVWTGADTGLRAADPQLLEMAKSFSLPRRKVLTAIRLPALLPHLVDALRVGISFAWKSGVAGEVIAIPRGTIGAQLYSAKVTLETVDLLAWTAAIIVLSVALERLFVLVGSRLVMRGGAPK